MRVPIALFAAVRDKWDRPNMDGIYEVFFDTDAGSLGCTCNEEWIGQPCTHRAAVMQHAAETGAGLMTIPYSDDMSADEMQTMVDNPELLRKHLMENLPIVVPACEVEGAPRA